ncbi:hypothetical protein FRC08_006574 [Ceratobasidium sp. 394]|nr:hypothetical protein FRC08_006574 [Ceratobasidium sp. 394]
MAKGDTGTGEADHNEHEPSVALRALSPELDSVHVSASASLSTSTTTAQTELLATANNLYHTVEDGAGVGDTV